MAKLIITLDGRMLREYALNKERTTIGRHPDNDLQLEDATVSGQHAAVLLLQNAYVEDLGSTNGTYLNLKRVQKRQLEHGDVIRIGRHELKFHDRDTPDFQSTVVLSEAPPQPESPGAPLRALVRITDGPRRGETLELSKSYNTVGRPGVQVAVIARRAQGYFLTPLTGVGADKSPIKLNDQAIGAESRRLQAGDRIEIGGVRMEFLLES